MVKPSHTGLLHCEYGCYDCDFGGDARNGVGIAAQHKEANPDHHVWIEQVTSMEWKQ